MEDESKNYFFEYNLINHKKDKNEGNIIHNEHSIKIKLNSLKNLENKFKTSDKFTYDIVLVFNNYLLPSNFTYRC